MPELFWKRMAGLYGYAWTKQNGVDPTTEWELCLAGTAPETVKKGIDRMTKDKAFEVFPPNPMQFRSMCLPRGEDLGLPSFEAAFKQATGGSTWKHPGVVYTLRLLDQFTFRQAKADKAESMFLEAWNKTLAFVMSGGGFPEKEVEIEEKVVKASLEDVAGTRDGLLGMFK